MSREKRPIAILDHAKTRHDAVFVLHGEEPGRPDLVRLVLEVAPHLLVERRAESYFDAMTEIRTEIEPAGWRLLCYGASRSVYPSGMSRDMGYGQHAYRHKTGEPARSRDIVDIFDVGDDVEVSTVEEQRAANQAWLHSLRRG